MSFHRMLPCVIMPALAVVAPLAATADEGHRHLGAHVHGRGKLEMALEGKKIRLVLEAPGADITGFEHEASSDEDKALLENAKSKLAAGLLLFKLPSPAGCKLDEAHVSVEDEDHDAEDHEENAEPEHDKEAHHSQFHVEYELSCADPGKATVLETTYFTAFPRAETLEVVAVSDSGQDQQVLTPERPSMDLARLGKPHE